MTYRRRITYCAIAACIIELLLLVFIDWVEGRARTDRIGTAALPEPVLLHLQPPEPVQHQLVDTPPVPAQEPVDPATDLIAEQDSKAADQSDVEGNRPAPHMDQTSEFDTLGAPPVPEQPSGSDRPPPAPEQEPREQAPPEAAPEAPERTEIAALPRPAAPRRESRETAPEPTLEPFDTARAEPPPAPLPSPPKEARGRMDGGVKSEGFLGFEAHRSELAPYLKEVRRSVEAFWKAALQTRYTGTKATEAVIDCAISPDGKLVKVEIVEAGNSPTYAALCKGAIEKAAPFGPFPFEVPPIYRSELLEIRWTFSFL
jgi:hypothetical protein